MVAPFAVQGLVALLPLIRVKISGASVDSSRPYRASVLNWKFVEDNDRAERRLFVSLSPVAAGRRVPESRIRRAPDHPDAREWQTTKPNCMGEDNSISATNFKLTTLVQHPK